LSFYDIMVIVGSNFRTF